MEFQRYSYMGGQLPWKYNQFGNPDSGVSMPFFYSYLTTLPRLNSLQQNSIYFTFDLFHFMQS